MVVKEFSSIEIETCQVKKSICFLIINHISQSITTFTLGHTHHMLQTIHQKRNYCVSVYCGLQIRQQVYLQGESEKVKQVS